ncbi:hypothetical protein G5B38_18555 [Pseudohalocynthiibacter aestuariivivens]|uniref:AAA+ family ATPase n=1 Tax=Roseovarius pelagicus TaxID=2980108 RepID=A0ABY6DEY7_9RHOB|nr:MULTISPECIES: hypothetical protein [Rhodobacterales]QIE47362.1 hypothetical protein G5B38_18555 [Pseudohalocynthiibacter aestuariivivens]UXX84075.1 hypothetical protein N7U68_05320 [Roseovarius pelagicus]
MRQFVTIATVAMLAVGPTQAQETEDDGFSLMEEGARLLFEGLSREMEPALRDLMGLTEEMEPKLREFAMKMGPALADIMGKIDDLSSYHAPEMLPNGDIIIRKKTPQEMLDVPKEGEEIEI